MMPQWPGLLQECPVGHGTSNPLRYDDQKPISDGSVVVQCNASDLPMGEL